MRSKCALEGLPLAFPSAQRSCVGQQLHVVYVHRLRLRSSCSVSVALLLCLSAPGLLISKPPLERSSARLAISLRPEPRASQSPGQVPHCARAGRALHPGRSPRQRFRMLWGSDWMLWGGYWDPRASDRMHEALPALSSLLASVFKRYLSPQS